MYSDKRYQDCPWFVRIWRRRFYLTIPYRAVYLWMINVRKEKFSFCWSITKGLAQCKMKWYYDWDEVKHKLEKDYK